MGDRSIEIVYKTPYFWRCVKHFNLHGWKWPVLRAGCLISWIESDFIVLSVSFVQCSGFWLYNTAKTLWNTFNLDISIFVDSLLWLWQQNKNLIDFVCTHTHTHDQYKNAFLNNKPVSFPFFWCHSWVEHYATKKKLVALLPIKSGSTDPSRSHTWVIRV